MSLWISARTRAAADHAVACWPRPPGEPEHPQDTGPAVDLGLPEEDDDEQRALDDRQQPPGPEREIIRYRALQADRGEDRDDDR